MTLTTHDHNRDAAGLTYVYPVLSRRAGGLSLGINLNPNNACNWRCVYCQVPNLVRGAAPEIDLALLRRELAGFLADVQSGVFYERFQVPAEQRKLCDIAVSGNGEPTSSRQLGSIVRLIESVLNELTIAQPFKRVLITNGSLMHQSAVQAALARWADMQGEIWFKLDAGSDTGLQNINQASSSASRQLRNLITAAQIAPTWVQTCVFQLDGQPWVDSEREAYLQGLQQAMQAGAGLQGVLLYTLARPSQQPEASRLTATEAHWMQALADAIRALGLVVQVSA